MGWGGCGWKDGWGAQEGAAQHTVARALPSVPCNVMNLLGLVLASKAGQPPFRYSHRGLATEGNYGTEPLGDLLMSVEFWAGKQAVSTYWLVSDYSRAMFIFVCLIVV